MQKLNTVTTLETEIADIEKQAAASKATLQSKLDELNAKRSEYHALAGKADEAETRLKNAREQCEIVNEIRVEAEAKITSLVGGESLSRSWFALVKACPTAVESWVHSGTGNRHPFVVHGETIAAATAAASVIEKLVPELEREDTSARKTADAFAKSNGITD